MRYHSTLPTHNQCPYQPSNFPPTVGTSSRTHFLLKAMHASRDTDRIDQRYLQNVHGWGKERLEERQGTGLQGCRVRERLARLAHLCFKELGTIPSETFVVEPTKPATGRTPCTAHQHGAALRFPALPQTWLYASLYVKIFKQLDRTKALKPKS